MEPTTAPRARRLRGEHGAAIVEFSLVFGIFLMIVYGLISFGLVLALKQSVTNAAHEGARAAIGAVDDQYVTTAKDKVADSLSWLGGNYEYDYTEALEGRMSGDVCDTTGVTVAGPRCIVVSIDYPYDEKPIIAPLPFIAGALPKTIGTTATVQLTYD